MPVYWFGFFFLRLFKSMPLFSDITQWIIYGLRDIMPRIYSQVFGENIYTCVYSEREKRMKQI